MTNISELATSVMAMFENYEGAHTAEKDELYLTEIRRLGIILTEYGVPFKPLCIHDGFQIIYDDPKTGDRVADAVCHSGSYGHQLGLLEIMGLVDENAVGDTVEGYLTGAEVAARMIRHFRDNQ